MWFPIVVTRKIAIENTQKEMWRDYNTLRGEKKKKLLHMKEYSMVENEGQTTIQTMEIKRGLLLLFCYLSVITLNINVVN